MPSLDKYESVVIIDNDGSFSCIHSDTLAPLYEHAHVEIQRASDVEPTGNMWAADMSRVGGPLLPPTQLRSDSLNAEREWLYENHFRLQ